MARIAYDLPPAACFRQKSTGLISKVRVNETVAAHDGRPNLDAAVQDLV